MAIVIFKHCLCIKIKPWKITWFALLRCLTIYIPKVVWSHSLLSSFNRFYRFLPPQLILPKTLQTVKFFHIQEKTNIGNISNQPASNNCHLYIIPWNTTISSHYFTFCNQKAYSIQSILSLRIIVGKHFKKLFSRNSNAEEPCVFNPYINIITAQIFEWLQEWEVYTYWPICV